CPDHDLAWTGLCNKMAQCLRRKYNRIEEKLSVPQIRRRVFLRQRPDAIGESPAHRIRAVGVGRQKTSAMRGTNLQSREPVERAFKDQVRQRDRCLQRIADRVGQQAAAAKPSARLQLPRAERMHEDQYAKFLALGPEGMKARIG